VRRFKNASNGRAAYLALDTHFSGGSFKALKVKQANEIVRNTKYTGMSASFETYRRIFTDAYLDLAEANQPVSDQGKVLHFLDGITCPELQSAINTVYTSDRYLNSFDEASTYLAGIAVRLRNRKQPQSTRQVNSVDTRPRSSKEWRALSKHEQDAIRKARRNEGGERKISAMDDDRKVKGNTPKADPKPKGDPNLKSISKFKGKPKKKQQPKRNVASVESEDVEEDEEVEDEDGEEEVYTPLAKRFAQTKRVKFKAIYRTITASTSHPGDRVELDSHSDHCIFAVGKVMMSTGDTFKVFGYDGKGGVERSVSTVAVAHDSPECTYILMFHQSFYDPKIVNSLINPNQMWRGRSHC